jgi:PTH1 family peptidyl-tRNA hydrolase
VVGLGNPGKKYDKTRHNIGFLVVDRCCERRGVEPSKKAFEGRYAFHGIGRGQVGFVKPQTFMNLSGESVRGFSDFYKVEPADILVVCDDLALPCGQLRLRASGSSGGQKGLEDLIRHLGTQAFPRLRVGIGTPPPYMDAADYVLGQFAEEERPLIEAAVDRAADAVRVWLEDGIERAMNRFNAKPEPAKKKEEGGDRASEPGSPGLGGRPLS